MSTKIETPKTPAAVAGEVDFTNEANPSLILTFSDGETLTLQPSMVTVAIAQQAMMHGFKQKLVDAAAIGRDPDTGRSATLADKKAAVQEVYDRLVKGEWNKRREGDGTSGTGLLVAALMALYPARDKANVTAWLETMSKEQVASIRLNPKIVSAMADIKAKRAGADLVDSDALLAGLDNE